MNVSAHSSTSAFAPRASTSLRLSPAQLRRAPLKIAQLGPECAGRELGQPALRRDVEKGFASPAVSGKLPRAFARRGGARPSEPTNRSARTRRRASGREPPLVVVREELGLVGGHVDVDRAFALAALAREAEVERVLDALVAASRLPSDFALQQLPQQMRAAARGVLLLARDHVARAHRAALVLAARADTDAAQRRAGEAEPWSSGNRKCVSGCGRLVVGAETQVSCGWRASISLPGFILRSRIPERLELAERLHQLLAEHLRQQRGARLAVAVLAGERAAVSDDDVGGAVDEFAELQDARLGLQVEVDAHVDAALAEVAVERAVVVGTRRISAKSRARYAPRRSGGTAASSQPSHLGLLPGWMAMAPSADSRTRHTCPASGGVQHR